MRQSQLFTKTRKESPKDEVSKNAQLLIRAGYIHKEIAGVYALLPLGLRVMKKIENIIREEMNLIGGQEIQMTTLQDPTIWKEADKWDDKKVDVWFKTELKNGSKLGLAFSHEEAIAEMLKQHMNSYKDLPFSVYQFQTKFRNELRAKSGIMRGREFLMKDMYSFGRTSEELHKFYNQAKDAYTRVFTRVGLGDYTYLTLSDGSVFSDWSHEFQTLSEAGEDYVYADMGEKLAINEEVYEDENIRKMGVEMGIDMNNLKKEKSIEVGNIFPIEKKVANALNFTYIDEAGNQQPVIMGSYGIGLGRVMGAVVEVLSDEKGIIWPENIAPFKVHLIALMQEEGTDVRDTAEKLYSTLTEKGIEVLYDDRDVRPGEKFADADLLGMPWRVVVSERALEAGGVELKKRTETDADIVPLEELLKVLQK
jgi:prolyl-tRNA synthetase